MTGFSPTADVPWAVEAHDLRKRYGRVHAVRGVDLTVAPGESFALLGPNGAGKTTTIAMLCTLARPSEGTARVAGFDVVAEQVEVRRRIGLVFQDPTLDTNLTAEQNLRFHAELYGVDRRAVPARLRDVLDLVGLWDRRHDLVRIFSGGMKRRLEIARGLLHCPRVLFLDEPTIGLDPQTRSHIWNYIDELKDRESVTMFLTTHYMDEAERCDRIAIMDDGELVVVDSPEALKAAIGDDRVKLRTDDDGQAVVSLRDRMDIDASLDVDGVSFRVPDGAEFIPRLVGHLDVAVRAVTVTRPTLDDVFMSYTGRTIRETEGSDDGGSRRWARARGKG